MTAKWTIDDVPGQQGRLAVVTGADTGLGSGTARVLAARGAPVVQSGAGTTIAVAAHPGLAASSRPSRDTAIQRRLWTVSEELTGVIFPV